jgi:hypothetical protein
MGMREYHGRSDSRPGFGKVAFPIREACNPILEIGLHYRALADYKLFISQDNDSSSLVKL